MVDTRNPLYRVVGSPNGVQKVRIPVITTALSVPWCHFVNNFEANHNMCHQSIQITPETSLFASMQSLLKNMGQLIYMQHVCMCEYIYIMCVCVCVCARVCVPVIASKAGHTLAYPRLYWSGAKCSRTCLSTRVYAYIVLGRSPASDRYVQHKYRVLL